MEDWFMCFLIKMHIICILILTTWIFKRCRFCDSVEIETHSSFGQLCVFYAVALSFLFFLLSFSSHSVLLQSVFCQSSLYCSFVSFLSFSPYSSLFYFLFINSLLQFLHCSTVFHFSLRSPQAMCCSTTSTVITAVLCAICSTTVLLIKLFEGCMFWVSREQKVRPK